MSQVILQNLCVKVVYVADNQICICEEPIALKVKQVMEQVKAIPKDVVKLSFPVATQEEYKLGRGCYTKGVCLR